jgi:hypothetical protein
LSELARNPYPETEEKLADQIEPTSTTGAMASVVTPRWHLIVHSNLGSQIYDWTHDPGEENDLIATPEGARVASQLAFSLPQGISRYAFSTAPERLSLATLLGDGTYDFPSAAEPQTTVNDYYRMAVRPGSTVKIEVKSQGLGNGSRLDPVLAIQDSQFKPLRTCRNPGDDHLRPPAISDKTPAEYDDLCINDDIKPGTQTDSQLELRVPQSNASEVQVYVHVLEWNVLTRGRKNYRIVVSGAVAKPDTSKHPVRKKNRSSLRLAALSTHLINQ